jgi:hypothetical protein
MSPTMQNVDVYGKSVLTHIEAQEAAGHGSAFRVRARLGQRLIGAVRITVRSGAVEVVGSDPFIIRNNQGRVAGTR